MAIKKGIKQVTSNKKAWHDYFVDEKFEAGIELVGTEVKSIRLGQINLKDSYCSFKDGELYVVGMHISPYEKGNIFNKDPMRKRRLLMHKKEILNLFGKTKQDGYTLIPLSVYFKNSRAVPRQKAARQARQHREARRGAGDGPRDEKQKPVKSKRRVTAVSERRYGDVKASTGVLKPG